MPNHTPNESPDARVRHQQVGAEQGGVGCKGKDNLRELT